MKCKKCSHFYAKMTGEEGRGYNPCPSCQLYGDTGRRPNVLTQECFQPRKKIRRKQYDKQHSGDG